MSTPVSLHSITLRVLIGQALFTAGHVLSTGGFLFYFANEFQPAAVLLALLQCTPEVAESAGLLVRPLVRHLGGRKWTWMLTLILARIAALGVPLTAFPELLPPGIQPIWLIIGSVAVWYVCQGMAYIAFLSWLSDLVPDHGWGRFFARRNLAVVAVMLVVPLAAGLLRRHLIAGMGDDAQRWSYVVIFAVAGLLALASILPMLTVPNRNVTAASASQPTWRMFRQAIAHPPFRLVLFYSWWLSLAQGLTQAAFFKYQVDVLKISVTTYYALSSLMLLLQIPLTIWAGQLSDRYGDRRPLFVSTLAVSLALLFWLAATPATWWLLFPAYAIWGLFGIVNLCGQNLALRLAPPSDNTLHLAMFRQVGGVLAGLAGLCGGWWLDELLRTAADPAHGESAWLPYHTLFLVSLIGRATAALWLLPIPQPAASGDVERRL